MKALSDLSKVILLGIFLLGVQSKAQNLPLPKSIQSPNTASLGKFGDVPVSFYTGTPNIGIPLYQINDYGIPLEISLNYDASGVRVNGMPSWTGQNWSLNAGGVITRTVKDGPDEAYVPESTMYFGDFYGYYYPISHDLLDTTNWNNSDYLWYLYSNSYPNNNVGNFHGREYQPDIFTFNFMGHSGKFFLSENGEWKVSSTSNLKVLIDSEEFEYPFNEPNVPFNNHDPGASYYNFPSPYPSAENIYTIRLIDDLGNIYTFGNTDQSVEYTIPFYNQQNTRWVANSWYLTKVEDRFGKTIYTFEYERGDYILSLYKYFNYNVFNAVDNDTQLLGFNINCYSENYNYFRYGGDLISPVYLNKITTHYGDINFNRSLSKGRSYLEDPNISSIFNGPPDNYGQPSYISSNNPEFYFYLLPYTTWQDIAVKLRNWQKLTSISGLEKYIVLDHNDVSANPEDNDRLKLESVKIDDRIYTLEYDGFDQLPHYLSTEIDHWGYYDGSPWVISISSFGSHYASRTTNSINVKKGMLKKLFYPTKGWTEFEWEANNYASYVSDDKSQLVTSGNTLAGGVRVKRIRDHDGNDYVITKDYKYVKGYETNPFASTSSGILESKPKHYWVDFSTEASNEPNVILRENIFSTNPILPLANYMGSHIGYSEVVEIFSNGGFNIYRFTSNENSNYRDEFTAIDVNPDPSPYTSFSDRSLLRGKLLEKSSFNADRLKVKSVIHEYGHDNIKFVKSLFLDAQGCSSSFGVGFLKANAQKLFYFDNNLLNEKTITYDDNGEQLVQETNYIWNDYPSGSNTFGDQFLDSKRVQTYLDQGDANQDYYTESYSYPFSMSSSINSELISQRFFPLLKTESFKNGNKIRTQQVEYDYFDSKLFPKKTLSSIGNNPLEETVIIDEYDTSKYLVEKYHQKDGRHTLIAYKDLLPIVKMEGKVVTSTSYLYSKVNEMSSPDKTLEEIIDLQQQVRNYYSDFMVTSYTFDPLVGPTSITDPRGETSYFEYDNYERLLLEKDLDGFILKRHSYNFKEQN